MTNQWHFVMTPKQILDQVEKDAEILGTRWLFSPEELVAFISHSGFPQEIADEIKFHIISIYVEWIHRVFDCTIDPSEGENIPSISDVSLSYCYHTLDDGANKKYAKVKKDFRDAIILSVTTDVESDLKKHRQNFPSDFYACLSVWRDYLYSNCEKLFGNTTDDSDLGDIHIGPDIAHWIEGLARATESYLNQQFVPKDLAKSNTSETGN